MSVHFSSINEMVFGKVLNISAMLLIAVVFLKIHTPSVANDSAACPSHFSSTTMIRDEVTTIIQSKIRLILLPVN
jgi:hypothetical protein